MRRINLVVLSALVGLGVAVLFFYFELAVRKSQDWVWLELFQSDEFRWLVFPLCITLSLVYFGAQKVLDPKASKKINQVATFPAESIKNFLIVLALGFLSLLAGPSLGPEAILIPACFLLAVLLARSVFKLDKTPKLYGSLGLVALFAAFFNSFVVGMLAILLVKKELSFKPNRQLVALSVITSASTVWMLSLLDSISFVQTPTISWSFNFSEIGWLTGLLLSGYLYTYALGGINKVSSQLTSYVAKQSWILHGFVAGGVLSLIYFIAGPLTQFTGNDSILPMFEQSTELGVLGLLGVLIGKICAIAWSKAAGYRGGLIFPSIFVASVLTAMVQLEFGTVSYVYGVIFALVGMLVADKKVKVLL